MSFAVWQDYAFAVAGLLIILAMLPMLRSPQKPPAWTSLLIAISVAVLGGASFTLHLYLGATLNLAQASLWAHTAWKARS